MITSTPPGPAPTPTSFPARLRALAHGRTAGLPAWVVMAQLFIGLGWLRAATEKLIDPTWWRGEGITDFIAQHEELTLGWYEPFVNLVVSPHVIVIGLIVVVAQLLAGVSLVSGRFTAAALAVGIILNLNFVAAGAVNPSAFYLVIQGTLALWMTEHSRARHRTVRLLSVAAGGAAVLGLLSLPFVMTLHPEEVIDDPAVMFVLYGALTAIAGSLARRQVVARGGDRRPRADSDLYR